MNRNHKNETLTTKTYGIASLIMSDQGSSDKNGKALYCFIIPINLREVTNHGRVIMRKNGNFSPGNIHPLSLEFAV